ncbi:MAG: protein kinase [Nannocystaceae bacterium]|nr:protein kinase [Nannocystaceae bacterium]
MTTDAARAGWSHPFGDVVVGGVPKAIELRLDPAIADPSRDEARLLELQQTLSRVRAPEVAQLRSVRSDGGRVVLRFDAFAGTPISELIGGGRPAAARVIAIVHGVARALAAAHREGALHRGLSPASVLVGAKDEVRVLDFGVGLLLKQDSPARALKLDPLTPERVFGLPPTPADDVYLLGCLGYVLATGEPPLVDDDAARLRRRHAIEDPPRLARTPNLAIPSSLAKLIDRCLAKDPEDRFESIDALIAELPPLPTAAVAPLLGTAARVPPPPPTAKPAVADKPASERSSPAVSKPVAPPVADKPASERSSPAVSKPVAPPVADKPASERSSPAVSKPAIADKPASERSSPAVAITDKPASERSSPAVAITDKPASERSSPAVAPAAAIAATPPAAEVSPSAATRPRGVSETSDLLRARAMRSATRVPTGPQQVVQTAAGALAQVRAELPSTDASPSDPPTSAAPSSAPSSLQPLPESEAESSAIVAGTSKAGTDRVTAQTSFISAPIVVSRGPSTRTRAIAAAALLLIAGGIAWLATRPAQDDAVARNGEPEIALALSQREPGDPAPQDAIASKPTPSPVGDVAPLASSQVAAPVAAPAPAVGDTAAPPPSDPLAEIDDGAELEAVAPAGDSPARVAELLAGAQTARREGRRAEAISAYKEVAALDPDNLQALEALTRLAFDRADFAQAVRWGKRAAAVAPGSGRVRIALGDAYFKLGRREDAQAQYDKAAKLGHKLAARRLAMVGGG